MKVLNIPCYSTFDGTSYPHNVTLFFDTAFINAMHETYPVNTRTVVINTSQSNINVRNLVNKFFGVEVMPFKQPPFNFVYNSTCGAAALPACWGWMTQIGSMFGVDLDGIQVSNNYACGTTSVCYPTTTVCLNGDVLGSNTNALYFGTPVINNQGFKGYNGFSTWVYKFDFQYVATGGHQYLDCNMEYTIYPEEVFDNVGLVKPQPTGLKHLDLDIEFRCQLDDATGTTIEAVKQLVVYIAPRTTDFYSDLNRIYGNFHFKNSMAKWEEYDMDNPYSEDGSSYEGGGDGTLGPGGLDYIDPAEIPEIPTLGAAGCGFMTMYNPSASELQALASYMWSNMFDLDTYKKLFSDPMQSIVGLAIVPIAPTVTGYKNVTFGQIDSGIGMNVVGNQYKKLNCGSVSVEKYVGCFMDYAPYTKISIYLPYIGIRELSADDVIGGSLNVQYIVDVLTGACACFISHSTRGVLYSYNGSCITNVPLTAQNFSGAIQNAVSAVIGGVGVIAGMATGAAPVTAMGITGLLNSAANTAINSKPQIQRSGNLGGSAGIMSIQKPYIIIERPNLSVPANVQHYVGQTSNLTRSLGSCSGFTMVEYIHLDGISATSQEIAEIESLLKQGVIL